MKWLLVFLLACTKTVVVHEAIEPPLQIVIKDCLPSKPPAEPELYCKDKEFGCSLADVDRGKKLDHLRELQIWVDITVKNCKYPSNRTFSNYLNRPGGTR